MHFMGKEISFDDFENLSFLDANRGVFRNKNIALTKKDIKASIGKDVFIIQAIRFADDLTLSSHHLVKRLREWYGYSNPEFNPDNHENFISLILAGKDDKRVDSMGPDLDKSDRDIILSLAAKIKMLYDERDEIYSYLEETMKIICPNLLAVAGVKIGAKLIEKAGSFKHLSELPASTIQLLGAEKALFRHIKTGARCPKYGVLLQHSLVNNSNKLIKGKAARILADKISIACKVDFFKGEFIGDKLLKSVEAKL